MSTYQTNERSLKKGPITLTNDLKAIYGKGLRAGIKHNTALENLLKTCRNPQLTSINNVENIVHNNLMFRASSHEAQTSVLCLTCRIPGRRSAKCFSRAVLLSLDRTKDAAARAAKVRIWWIIILEIRCTGISTRK